MRGEQASRSADDSHMQLAAFTRRASTNGRESDSLGRAGETIATIEEQKCE
jgi:hypothetical protein